MASFVGTSGADTVTPSGVSAGVIAAPPGALPGPGADGLAGLAGADSLDGGTGNDRLDGGDDDDTLSDLTGSNKALGGGGNDTITLGAGNDLAYGGASADRIFGGAGDDLLRGGGGNDWIESAGGADDAKGGSGRDTLDGQAGDDTLTGGPGRDRLTGGEGADLFRFAAGDSGTTVQTRDTITDFQPGIDMIDLSEIAAGLLFTPGGAFTGTAGEVIYTAQGLLRIDLDGDGLADMTIVLDGAPLLSADDLLL